MDARQAELLRTIDPVVLGGRLRAARLAAGLTQGQMAGGDVTVSYVSRIESGQRRPEARVLELLAAKVETSVEELLTGASATDDDELRLELSFAELALESGDGLEACRRIEEMLKRRDDTLGSQRQSADFLHARALEATGKLDAAIIGFRRLLGEGAQSPYWLRSGIALCRCFREVGDFGHSVQVGEEVLDVLREQKLETSDEAIQLSVSVAASYFFRGDTGHAVRLCMTALEQAERTGSPAARAAAYWNASVFESERGSVAAAIPLAERALALLTEGQDLRNIARLRSELGFLQLLLDPPQYSEALVNLERAGQEMLASSASQLDIQRKDLSMARALLHTGDVSQARALAGQTYLATKGVVPLLAADARAVQGQAAAAMGDMDDAKTAYQDAVLVLSGVGGDRWVAQLWVELGGLLEDVGDHDAARDAYLRAAVSSGLRVGSTTSARL